MDVMRTCSYPWSTRPGPVSVAIPVAGNGRTAWRHRWLNQDDDSIRQYSLRLMLSSERVIQMHW